MAKPVMFPLGRSSRSTMPMATGSTAIAKTIGIVRVSRWRAMLGRFLPARMMSGLQADQLCRTLGLPGRLARLWNCEGLDLIAAGLRRDAVAVF
jgi:hypothetical protein